MPRIVASWLPFPSSGTADSGFPTWHRVAREAIGNVKLIIERKQHYVNL
jgi:hypothetical protein